MSVPPREPVHEVSADAPVVDGVLKPGVTWHARDAAGTPLVLKRLPADCLRHGALHPAVRLRLTRLREVPMAAFANVVGVMATEQGVVLVSEFVAGRAMTELTDEQRRPHAAEARRLVEALHQTGLVHGAVSPGNFVLEPAGRLRLIDPSPLLYDDPRADVAAVAKWFGDGPADRTKPGRASPRPHAPTLAAAAALAATATAAAVGWALHVAGRP